MSSNLATVGKNIGRSLSNNAPTALSIMAVFGVITTAFMVAKATPKVMHILEEEKHFREEGNLPEIDFLDKIELASKPYLPLALSGLLTIACIIGSNHINAQRNAALISLIGVAEATLREYQEKVIETIGETKEEKIRGEIAQDKLKQNPVKESSIILTGNGNYLCFDNFSKRYFRSNIDMVNRAANDFNRKLNQEGWLNINVWYDLLDLDEIELGQEYGWNADRSLLDLKISSKMAYDQDHTEPCAVIDYMVTPYHI